MDSFQTADRNEYERYQAEAIPRQTSSCELVLVVVRILDLTLTVAFEQRQAEARLHHISRNNADSGTTLEFEFRS